MKLWGGRFNKATDQLVEEFNASLSFDYNLYQYDILGSKVHVKMLARTKIISEEEKDLILNGLNQVEKDIKSGEIVFDNSLEDIHTLIEKNLIAKIGELGGKLHTARSRNDQVALDTRLYLRAEVFEIQELIKELLNTLLDLAEDYQEIMMPGYTHLQRAQPITLGHYLLAYYFKFKRDYQRLEDNLKRINILPLGSGALAGTTFPIDRNWVAQVLDFEKVAENSLDGVSDRDYIIEFMSIAATCIMHFSRLSEELIIWSSSEFDFIELDDAYTTGSSIMPQKKNPDVAELTRGKTGRIFGHLIQILTTLKGLPLAYNKDMQEDKEGLFDTVKTIKIILAIYPKMLKTMKVKADKLKQAVKEGFVNATDLADYLAKKGLPFRQAHQVVGKAVLYAIEENLELEQISLKKWQSLFPDLKEYFTEDIYQALSIENCINDRNSIGGPAVVETKRVLTNEYKWLKTKIKIK